MKRVPNGYLYIPVNVQGALPGAASLLPKLGGRCRCCAACLGASSFLHPTRLLASRLYAIQVNRHFINPTKAGSPGVWRLRPKLSMPRIQRQLSHIPSCFQPIEAVVLHPGQRRGAAKREVKLDRSVSVAQAAAGLLV